jgi:hypothetical protein
MVARRAVPVGTWLFEVRLLKMGSYRHSGSRQPLKILDHASSTTSLLIINRFAAASAILWIVYVWVSFEKIMP